MAFLSSGGDLVNDQLVRYQAEVARRAKALAQNQPLPDEPPPLISVSGSPPTLWYGSGPDTPLALRLSEAQEPPSAAGISPSANLHPIVVDIPLGSELLAPAAKPDFEPNKRKKVARAPAKPRTQHAARSQTKQGVITNRAGIIQHSKILIVALQEALDYDPLRGHNQRPPALWSDDPAYLRDVDTLVVELRRLNSLLEAKRPSKKEANRAVIDLARHFDKFLHAYASWFGKGAAALTLFVIAGLLQHAGLDPTAVCAAINKLSH